MHRVRFSYALEDDGGPTRVANPLIDLLRAVSEHGSISAAARSLGLSYRHVWGELKRWETVLGETLIVWEKGQAARLTVFGEKLMWAERQAQARLMPQIEALRAELERVFAVAFDDDAHVLTMYASHDEALVALAEHARRQRLHLDIRFCGSVDAIRALNEGRCMMAGFHTLTRPEQGSLARRVYKPLLRPGLHKIIGFSERVQGLIVAPGNPCGITGLASLARGKVRFVNRVRGSGTRVLLDDLLAREGIAAQAIRGYALEEPSHSAVAEAVASGAADVALGIAPAAYARGLDFIPVVEERYHLACLKSSLALAGSQALLGLLRSTAWQKALAVLPGYRPVQSGEVLAMREVLPWWTFRTPKAASQRT